MGPFSQSIGIEEPFQLFGALLFIFGLSDASLTIHGRFHNIFEAHWFTAPMAQLSTEGGQAKLRKGSRQI